MGDSSFSPDSRHFKTFLGAAMFLGAALPAAAQEAADEIEELVITATRVATPRARVASSMTVISAADIARRQALDLADVLDPVPGLRLVQLGGRGHQTSIFSRGTNSNHTLVLVDGIEVADPSAPNRAFDISHFMADDIERVEVVRGSQSTLYGSDAIGAVINIITKRGSGPAHGTARLEGGSFGTFRARAGVSGAAGALDYAVSAGYFETGGETVSSPARRGALAAEDDGYQNLTFSGKFGWAASDALDVTFVVRYIDGESEIDSSAEDPNSVNTIEQVFLRGQAAGKFFGDRWRAKLGFSYADTRRGLDNPADALSATNQTSRARGRSLKADWQNDLYLVEGHVLTAGLEVEEEKFDNTAVSDFPAFFFSSTESSKAKVSTTAVYFQDQFQFGDRFSGTVGVRVDDREFLDARATWQIAPVYSHIETGTRIKASVGTGFSAPTLFAMFGEIANNFGGTFRGNPNLKPEKSTAWEVGFEQDLAGGRLRLGATYFEIGIDDLIISDDFFTTMVNINKADIKGVESFIEAQPFDSLRVRLDHTFTDAVDSLTGLDLLRRPNHKFDGDVDFRPVPGVGLSLGVHYVGQTRDFGGVRLSAYTLVNLAASWEITPQITLRARIDNLFDREYEVASGLRGTGFAAYGGLGVRF